MPWWPALAAGDIRGTLVREILRSYRETNGDFGQMMRSGLSRLQVQQAITQNEAEQLVRIVDAVTGTADLVEVARQVRKTYEDLIDAWDATPVSLAIASIAVNTTLTAIEYGNGKVADVLGGIMGAFIGFWMGGGPSAVAGAVVGAGLAAAIEKTR